MRRIVWHTLPAVSALLCLLTLALWLRTLGRAEYLTYRTATTDHDLYADHGGFYYELSPAPLGAGRGLWHMCFAGSYGWENYRPWWRSLWGSFEWFNGPHPRLGLPCWPFVLLFALLPARRLLSHGLTARAKLGLAFLVFLLPVAPAAIGTTWNEWTLRGDGLPDYLTAALIGSVALGARDLLRIPNGHWPWQWRGRRTARRLRNGLCLVCGYDLRGGHDRCPECGAMCTPAPGLGFPVPAHRTERRGIVTRGDVPR